MIEIYAIVVISAAVCFASAIVLRAKNKAFESRVAFVAGVAELLALAAAYQFTLGKPNETWIGEVLGTVALLAFVYCGFVFARVLWRTFVRRQSA
jgi:cytochrome c biogenesis protein CcdA